RRLHAPARRRHGGGPHPLGERGPTGPPRHGHARTPGGAAALTRGGQYAPRRALGGTGGGGPLGSPPSGTGRRDRRGIAGGGRAAGPSPGPGDGLLSALSRARPGYRVAQRARAGYGDPGAAWRGQSPLSPRLCPPGGPRDALPATGVGRYFAV